MVSDDSNLTVNHDHNNSHHNAYCKSPFTILPALMIHLQIPSKKISHTAIFGPALRSSFVGYMT